MSIDLGALVATAFKAVGANVKETLKTITYRTAGTQVYDPATGVLASTGQDYSITDAIMTGYKRAEREFDFQNSRRQAVEAGDQKCLIPYASLPIATISMEDRIIEGAKTWRIISHELDPTGKALHTFQLRQA
jgi:hypothetical protein